MHYVENLKSRRHILDTDPHGTAHYEQSYLYLQCFQIQLLLSLTHFKKVYINRERERERERESS